ncbi:MAG: hypothetical protein RR782_02655 [Clostridium sp.]
MASIDNVINALSVALDSVFPNVDIYTKSVEQGFSEPCFFIKVLKSDLEQELGRRYRKDIKVDIHYFSDKGERDCYEVLEKLYVCLGTINLAERSLKAKKVSGEVIDGILHFFISFPHLVIEEKPTEIKMGKLEVNIINGKK